MILSSTFRAFPSLLLWCCLVFPLNSAIAQDEVEVPPPDNKPSRSVVHGRVFFADSEQPLRRATVRLRKELNKDVLKSTISGRRGEFRFQGVAAGTYYIEVDARGIVAPTNGISFTDMGFSIEESGVTLVTVDGTNDVKTEIRAVRGGSLTGRVSYNDGEPATHARIILYRQQGQNPILFFTDKAVVTDDRGVYRIEGLPSGKYIVGVVENHAGGNKKLPRDSAGLVTAYHSDATNFSAATVVTVEAGSETHDVNIKLAEDPRRISGSVKWKRNDSGVKDAVVFLRRVGDPQTSLDFMRFMSMVTPSTNHDKTSLVMRDMFFFSQLSTNAPYTETDDEGNWSFPDLPQGTYVLSVEAPFQDAGVKRRPGEEPLDAEDSAEGTDLKKGVLRGSVEVTVKDKNVDNILINVSDGGSISGSVVIEGNKLGPVFITISSVFEGIQSVFNTPAFVKEDGTFVLKSVRAGSAWVDIIRAPVPQYYIRSMTGKGLNLLHEPLTLIEGEQVTGVQIVVASDLVTVEGRVVASSGGGGIAGAGVVLLPADQRKWNIRSFASIARADADGRFSMRMAPGEYLALAWSLANEPTGSIESHVRAHMGATRRITLQPGETRNLEIQTSTSPRER